MALAGYGEHGRGKGWNTKDVSNDFETKVLDHDRDVEFYVDAMDVDETNQIVSAANITRVFDEEHAIPEVDAYRYSKLYSEFVNEFGGTVDTTALTEANILQIFDKQMEEMDDAGVPQEGRILYLTPATRTLLKNAEQIQRSLSVTSNNGRVDRIVHSLDDVRIQPVPSARMKTAYDFTDGFVPAAGAKQINMMLIHPRAVIAPIKHSVIYLWAPGTHTSGDGWLYQNRKYWDLFLIENKITGVAINRQA